MSFAAASIGRASRGVKEIAATKPSGASDKNATLFGVSCCTQRVPGSEDTVLFVKRQFYLSEILV